ncbi:hypothetical protein [Nostoc sp. WHI]|uniref:hypothetical protein n=1 Tax=Nostoc sp. WHI TaxID=2650611 RepID=UPI0018C60176|nr:hypothetical protein [Nostoc sp. WHI]
MNTIISSFLNISRYLISRRRPGIYNRNLDKCKINFDIQGQNAGDYIKDILSKDKPCMISRLGSTELDTILVYLNIIDKSSLLLKSIKYINGDFGWFWWDESVEKKIINLSGFFPADETNLNRFCELMIRDIKNIDVLGSWLEAEEEFAKLLPNTINATRVSLKDLEPYRHERPWSAALEGKTVLVIYPFEESIKQQYKKRHLLFADSKVLPEFELKTIPAVQSIAGNSVDFPTWFDALNFMCDRISNIDFDIAVIGAGAYGLPLAAFVKNIGKKSIHLGGGTQILFGIRGARWDERPYYQELFNEHWVHPLPSEKPATVNNFVQSHGTENGCYW